MGNALSVEEQQRLQYAAVRCGRRRTLRVMQVYGWAEGATAAADNARVVMRAISWLRCLGAPPRWWWATLTAPSAPRASRACSP
eukprot:335551-Lingulodinium_polyedra.AAC.1